MEFLKKVFKSCKANKKEAKKKENYKVLLNKENIYREDPQEYLSKTQLININKSIRKINQNLLDTAQVVEDGQDYPYIQVEKGKKLLLLDLDKTLIFYDILKGLYIRPHLQTFLKAVAPYYTIYVFTASVKEYAQTIVENLRLQKQFIKGILNRKNCMTITNSNGNIYTIKCLKVLTHCELKNMVLVDDNPFSYLYNQNNGIPILPYRGDCKDKQLLKLIKVLKNAFVHEDVRDYIQKRFRNIDGKKQGQ